MALIPSVAPAEFAQGSGEPDARAELARDAEHLLMQAAGTGNIAAGAANLPHHTQTEDGPLVVIDLARDLQPDLRLV